MYLYIVFTCSGTSSTSTSHTVSWLIVVLALRPDRFSHAALKFTDRCSSEFVADDLDDVSPDLNTVMRDAEAVYGGFIVMPRCVQRNLQAGTLNVIRQLAKARYFVVWNVLAALLFVHWTKCLLVYYIN